MVRLLAAACAAMLFVSGAAGAAEDGLACPSKDIRAFFRVFAESAEMQRAFTAPTVYTAFVDWNADPEPVEATKPMPRDQLHYPIVPNREMQDREGLLYREVDRTGRQVTVALEVPDTDSQLLYTFELGECWTLVKVVDPAFATVFEGEAPPAKTQGPAISVPVLDLPTGTTAE